MFTNKVSHCNKGSLQYLYGCEAPKIETVGRSSDHFWGKGFCGCRGGLLEKKTGRAFLKGTEGSEGHAVGNVVQG